MRKLGKQDADQPSKKQRPTQFPESASRPVTEVTGGGMSVRLPYFIPLESSDRYGAVSCPSAV